MEQELIEQAMVSDIERAEMLAAAAQWIKEINRILADKSDKPPEKQCSK